MEKIRRNYAIELFSILHTLLLSRDKGPAMDPSMGEIIGSSMEISGPKMAATSLP